MSITSNLLATLDAVEAQDEADRQMEMERNKLDPRGFGGAYGDDPDYYAEDLPVPEIVVESKDTKVKETPDSDITEDYTHVRNTTYALQAMTTELLQGAVSMAVKTENPRAYGTVNELVGTIQSLNKDLIANAKAIQEIQAKNRPLEEGESRTEVEVESDGSVKVTKSEGGRTSQNILAMVEEMRRNGGDASTINNKDVLEGEIEEAETNED